MLRSVPGEIEEVGGRLCVAVLLDKKGPPPNGLIVGTSPGGATILEPMGAVKLNNEYQVHNIYTRYSTSITELCHVEYHVESII